MAREGVCRCGPSPGSVSGICQANKQLSALASVSHPFYFVARALHYKFATMASNGNKADGQSK